MQFPLFSGHSDSANWLIQKYVLSATRPIHRTALWTDTVTVGEAAADFMDRCLRNEEADRCSARQLLQHEFISKGTMERAEFTAYVAGSNMGRSMRQTKKLEMVSIRQSLAQLVVQNKLSRQDMATALQSIAEETG